MVVVVPYIVWVHEDTFWLCSLVLSEFYIIFHEDWWLRLCNHFSWGLMVEAMLGYRMDTICVLFSVTSAWLCASVIQLCVSFMLGWCVCRDILFDAMCWWHDGAIFTVPSSTMRCYVWCHSLVFDLINHFSNTLLNGEECLRVPWCSLTLLIVGLSS